MHVGSARVPSWVVPLVANHFNARPSPVMHVRGLEFLRAEVLDVVGWLRAERAQGVQALDVSHLLRGAIGETLVFATGMTRAHMLRCAKAVRHEFKEHNVLDINGRTPTIEGLRSDEWLVVDGGRVVVSVMVPEAREQLALEHHWEEQGATRISLPVDESSAQQDDWQALSSASAAAGAAPGVWSSVTDDGMEDEAVYRESGTDDQQALLDAERRLAERQRVQEALEAEEGYDDYDDAYAYYGDEEYYAEGEYELDGSDTDEYLYTDEYGEYDFGEYEYLYDDDYYANDQEYIEGYEETDYRAEEEYYYEEDEPPRQPKLGLPSPKQR